MKRHAENLKITGKFNREKKRKQKETRSEISRGKMKRPKANLEKKKKILEKKI